MAAIHDLKLDHARVNVNGGACALGHPIGATGARILTTLVHALKRRGGKRGIASLCIGGGEATAVAIELVINRDRCIGRDARQLVAALEVAHVLRHPLARFIRVLVLHRGDDLPLRIRDALTRLRHGVDHARQ
jgi:hypothetical protein